MMQVPVFFSLFQIADRFSVRCGIFDLAAGAAADVAPDIDDKYLVGHVYLALVHVVQHLLGAFRPHFIISRMAEETDADDDVALKRQALLGFDELLLEAGAPAKGYDFVSAYHTTKLAKVRSFRAG